MIDGWRFRSEYDALGGRIVTHHAFSSGAHYDAEHVALGPVVGCDLHDVPPGAGFDWHAHRGVVIVSRVVEGTLRHEDASGSVVEVPAGEELLVQATGDGIRHRETNASTESTLRFVQLTLLVDVPQRVWRVTTPAQVADGVWVGSPAPLFSAVVDGAVVLSVAWSESISAD